MRLLLAIILAYPIAGYGNNQLSAQSSSAFSESVMIDEQPLQLCNSAKIKVMALFNVGQAALYLKDCKQQVEPLNQPIQLSIIYQRKFTPEDFQKSAYKLLQRNLSEQQFEAIEDQLQAFNSNYQAIEKGERYDICYSEKTGLMLHKNGQLISQSPSQALGESYFQIWFGERPFNKKLKKALLKQ